MGDLQHIAGHRLYQKTLLQSFLNNLKFDMLSSNVMWVYERERNTKYFS